LREQQRIPPVLVDVEVNKLAQVLGTDTVLIEQIPSGVQHRDKFFETSRFSRCLPK
jgi:hypothetical protein